MVEAESESLSFKNTCYSRVGKRHCWDLTARPVDWPLNWMPNRPPLSWQMEILGARPFITRASLTVKQRPVLVPGISRSEPLSPSRP